MSLSFLSDLEALYFFYQPGCEACEAGEAELRAFERAHPKAAILRLNAGGPYPDRLGVKVKATPTYLFRRGEQGATHEGFLDQAGLERWLKKLGAEAFGD